MIYPTADEMRASARYRPTSVADRLPRHYEVEASACWRWTGSITTSGYGHFSISSRYYQAHRLTYILHRGSIPDGSELDHLCRNRGCVNPWHLEVVDHATNVQRGNRSRLTTEQVLAIRVARANGAGVRALARLYGVNHATVSRVVNGLIWKGESQVSKGEAA